jgi:hypothetical protein
MCRLISDSNHADSGVFSDSADNTNQGYPRHNYACNDATYENFTSTLIEGDNYGPWVALGDAMSDSLVACYWDVDWSGYSESDVYDSSDESNAFVIPLDNSVYTIECTANDGTSAYDYMAITCVSMSYEYYTAETYGPTVAAYECLNTAGCAAISDADLLTSQQAESNWNGTTTDWFLTRYLGEIVTNFT